MEGPLSHLKVIEIASVLAGPAVGMFFSENGASVLKIENKKTNGDVTRSWKLPSEKSNEISAYFSSVNWKKEYLFLDFYDAKDKLILFNHIKDADILIINFKKGDAGKFGLSAKELRSLNPNLIVGEITGFGQDDDRLAYDLILQAESGFMSMNGTPTSGPVKMPIALIDVLAAHQLKEGLLLALLNRNNTGGQWVTVSLYDAAVASLVNQATNWLMAGEIPQRIGSIHPNIAPYGELFFTLDDKQITFAIGSNAQFKRLCEVLQLDNLPSNKLYRSNINRIKNRKELSYLLANKVKTKKAEELIQTLIKKSVPVAIIKNLKEVFADEKAKALILEEMISDQNTKRVRTSIFKISEF